VSSTVIGTTFTDGSDRLSTCIEHKTFNTTLNITAYLCVPWGREGGREGGGEEKEQPKAQHTTILRTILITDVQQSKCVKDLTMK